MDVLPLVDFIVERERVRIYKEDGLPKPWTMDPILQRWRFCNVRRNDDLQTRLIHRGWLRPHVDDPDVWFAMAAARYINWWPTLEVLGYPVPWKPVPVLRKLEQLKADGAKVFTGAYIVSTNGMPKDKAAYVVENVLNPLWTARKALRPRAGDTLASFHRRLSASMGVGSFMAAQIIADVKYAPGSPLYLAEDWATWAAPGPGSLRGLNRVCGDPPDTPWNGRTPSRVWEDRFEQCRQLVLAQLVTTSLTDLTGQDLQNCLCEFDKYERVRLGQGRPRSGYNGTSS